MLVDQGVQVPADVMERAASLAVGGRTVLLVAQDDQVVGLLVLEDTIRPEARGVIERLSQLGIRTVLVTGDNAATAERVAAELGIQEVHGEVLPQEKSALVKLLQEGKHRVAFVGDGVNDGPALALADVGVAMGVAGTDVAIETAEIALLSDDLERLPHLLTLSRHAMRAIRQNLVFSLGVLAVAVGLAIPGILSPVTGALLHELSSIPVIGNSARIIGLRDRQA
jgi:Cd2+/Zn2+-exporting ATPase